MLNKSGESRYTPLIPGLRGKALSFSLLNIMLTVSLSYNLYYIEPSGFPTDYVKDQMGS